MGKEARGTSRWPEMGRMRRKPAEREDPWNPGNWVCHRGKVNSCPARASVFSGKGMDEACTLHRQPHLSREELSKRRFKHCFSEVGEAKCWAAVNDARLHCCCSPPLLPSTSQDSCHVPTTHSASSHFLGFSSGTLLSSYLKDSSLQINRRGRRLIQGG